MNIFGEGLSHRVALYVPTTVNVSEVLDSETADHYIEIALRFLSQQFGGATALSAQGAWVSENGTLVIEKITIVYAFARELSTGALAALKEFAGTLKSALGQENIAVEIDGKFFLT